jgi:hypothetical protein
MGDPKVLEDLPGWRTISRNYLLVLGTAVPADDNSTKATFSGAAPPSRKRADSVRGTVAKGEGLALGSARASLATAAPCSADRQNAVRVRGIGYDDQAQDFRQRRVETSARQDHGSSAKSTSWAWTPMSMVEVAYQVRNVADYTVVRGTERARLATIASSGLWLPSRR